MKKTNNTINDIIESGSEITGGVGGALVGLLIAGPAGAALGGAAGPVITKAFKIVGAEIKKRVLGKREEIRIGAAYYFALRKISENESAGKTLRTDGFFTSDSNRRPDAEETLEGVILSSQREFEELKIKFLGNLYANICFNQDISKEHGTQLIKTGNALSFRQFCILQLLYERQIENEQLNVRIRELDNWQIDLLDIVAEMRDLQQKGLVSISTTFDGGNNSNPILLGRLLITQGGQLFCRMLSLDEIEKDDLDRINKLSKIKE